MSAQATQKDPQKALKTWVCKADGVYLHKPSGFYYWRPWRGIDGARKRSWEALQTTNLTIAKERFAKLKYPSDQPVPPVVSVTMGQVIRHYAASGYPDKHKQPRVGQTLDDETTHCDRLLEFFDHVTVESCGPAACDRYHTWRQENLRQGTGNRCVDRELNTLNNACRWGVRSEFIKYNPISERPRYQSSREVHHCREYCPQNADELHDAARHLFSHPNSVVLGFQLLAEASSGLRTREVLMWGEGIYGTLQGTNLNVWRLKGQTANNPYVVVNDGLSAVLAAHKAWKEVRYPDRQECFPSHCGGTVDKGALAHALRRLHTKGLLKRKLTSHGAGRAFYVLVRRSQGAKDETIAFEIGHSSNGACIRSTYGGIPEEWRNGGGPNLNWLPSKVPVAWAELEKNGWKFEQSE